MTWTKAITKAGVAVTALLALFVLAPLVIVVAAAFAPSDALGISSEQWVAGAGSGRAFRAVFETYGLHLAHSAALALGAAALAVTVGAPAGIALGTAERTRSQRWLEVMVTLPLAVPGLVTAIALLSLYGTRAGPWTLLVVGHVLYTMPYAARSFGAAARVSALRSLLEAARTMGASRAQRARLVTWPALRRAFATSLLLALAVSFGEFNVSFLLATPSSGTFPTALYLTYTTNSFPVAAAATTVLLAGLLPLFVLSLVLGGDAEQAP